MEVKLTSRFQKLHFLQNLVQMLMRSNIATLKKLSNICRKLSMRREKKIGDADQYALLIWDVFRGQKTCSINSLLQQQKILNEYVSKNSYHIETS